MIYLWCIGILFTGRTVLCFGKKPPKPKKLRLQLRLISRRYRAGRRNPVKKYALKKILAGIVAAVLLLSLTGCGSGKESSKNDDSLRKVLDAGQFVLGLDVDFPPMGFLDETGEIVGFDIDVAQEVCNRLGVKLVKKGINWDTKEDTLNSGEIDCIWNGMSITPGRAEAMNLSDPYMKNELIVIILGESDARNLSDLTGKKVGVQSGSTALETLEKSKIYPSITVVTFDDNLTLLQKLADREVDAALVDSIVAYYFIFSDDNQFYVLPDSLGEEKYAVGFRKNDQALRDKVQQIISEMKADGTLSNISKKWFGSDITIVK